MSFWQKGTYPHSQLICRIWILEAFQLKTNKKKTLQVTAMQQNKFSADHCSVYLTKKPLRLAYEYEKACYAFVLFEYRFAKWNYSYLNLEFCLALYIVQNHIPSKFFRTDYGKKHFLCSRKWSNLLEGYEKSGCCDIKKEIKWLKPSIFHTPGGNISGDM